MKTTKCNTKAMTAEGTEASAAALSGRVRVKRPAGGRRRPRVLEAGPSPRDTRHSGASVLPRRGPPPVAGPPPSRTPRRAPPLCTVSLCSRVTAHRQRTRSRGGGAAAGSHATPGFTVRRGSGSGVLPRALPDARATPAPSRVPALLCTTEDRGAPQSRGRRWGC